MTYSLSRHPINKTSTGVQMIAGKGSRGSSLQYAPPARHLRLQASFQESLNLCSCAAMQNIERVPASVSTSDEPSDVPSGEAKVVLIR